MREPVGGEDADRDGPVAVVKVLWLRRLRGEASRLRTDAFTSASLVAVVVQANEASMSMEALIINRGTSALLATGGDSFYVLTKVFTWFLPFYVFPQICTY